MQSSVFTACLYPQAEDYIVIRYSRGAGSLPSEKIGTSWFYNVWDGASPHLLRRLSALGTSCPLADISSITLKQPRGVSLFHGSTSGDRRFLLTFGEGA
jgi:hypothetical protein